MILRFEWRLSNGNVQEVTKATNSFRIYVVIIYGFIIMILFRLEVMIKLQERYVRYLKALMVTMSAVWWYLSTKELRKDDGKC